MTRKTRFLLLTAAILVGFTLGGSMASSTVDALRPEGAVMLAVRDDNALLADVAPPSLDVGESVSTVARLATATGAEQAHLSRDLQEQRQAFEAAVVRWRAHPRMRSPALQHVIETGEAFHRAVEAEYLPVVRRGDTRAASQMLQDRIGPLDDAQHHAAQALTEETQRRTQADLRVMSDLSQSRPRMMLFTFAALLLVLAAAIA